MSERRKAWLLAGAIALMVGALALVSGCQTVSGLGRDISAWSDGNAESHYNDRHR